MEYQEGSLGRVFVARFDHGEDFLEGLTKFIKQKNILCGWFQIIGGLRQSSHVTGPVEPVMPPEPVWEEVEGARETLGSGSVYWSENEPVIHLHAALGEYGKTTTGCIRKNTRVYLILEVIIFVINDMVATRPFFKEGGFNKLTFS
ncbi:MAG: DNA-binding protein [Bacteroidetes bacterium]|nr:DNA-binding protein [Bacteroidota bacterium]